MKVSFSPRSTAATIAATFAAESRKPRTGYVRGNVPPDQRVQGAISEAVRSRSCIRNQ